MSATLICDFPFKVIATWGSLREALAAGVDSARLWSVVDGDDDDDGNGCETYGPPHHYVNLRHIAETREKHDGATYYETTFERGNA